MKALTVYLFDTEGQLRVVTMTANESKDIGWDWGSDNIWQLESDSEAADRVRDHLLGCIADIDWQKIIKRLPKTPEYHIPDKFVDYER